MTDAEASQPGDEPTGGDENDAASAEPPAESYKTRQRFRAATDEELDPQCYIVADDRSALRATLRGGSIAEDRGDADFIGGALRNLARVLRETANIYRAGTGQISNPQLRNLAFGHSVVVDLEISPEEDIQIGTDNTRHSPTIDAAHAIARLLMTSPDELLPQAIRLGPDVVAAYKKFLNVLAEDAVTLEWQPVEWNQVVVVRSEDARVDFVILDREGERHTETLETPGKLTMADSELRQFALRLPPDVGRPQLLKNKQRIRGTYSEEMGVRLKQEGLWDTQVMATIAVTHDVPGTTATPRDPTFVLIDAEPMIEAPQLFDA